MKHQATEDESDPDFDGLPDHVPPHVEHLSRKWAEDEERHTRHGRQTITRRRIEDWREEQALRRAFEDDLEDLD